MVTSYSKIDIVATRSYTWIKEAVDFILAQEAGPPNKKKNCIEELLKPPNIIKSKRSFEDYSGFEVAS